VSLPLGRIEEANAAAQAGALVFRHIQGPTRRGWLILCPVLFYPKQGLKKRCRTGRFLGKPKNHSLDPFDGLPKTVYHKFENLATYNKKM
jgi:hypothetical protein